MKIISKFKDFYDFKVAKYGVDERLIYERHPSDDNPKIELSDQYLQNDAMEFEIYIGNYLVYGFKSKSKIYTNLDIDLSSQEKPNYRQKQSLKFKNGDEIFVYSEYHNSHSIYRSDRYNDEPITITRSRYFALNVGENLLDAPIIIHYPTYENGKFSMQIVANPNLSKFGVYIDPDFVWQAIVEFLSSLKSRVEISRAVDDNVKIERHGFDKKRSFRPKIKS